MIINYSKIYYFGARQIGCLGVNHQISWFKPLKHSHHFWPFSDLKLRMEGQLTIESLDMDRPSRESKGFQKTLTHNDTGYGCWFDECNDLQNVLVSVKFNDFQFFLADS